jgi:hypothetical protein
VRRGLVFLLGTLIAAGITWRWHRTVPPATDVRPMTLAEAAAVFDAVGDRAPVELRTATTDAAWSGWVRKRDVSIRARLDRGDEDSLVNFMLYGTTFTSRPRATPDWIATGSGVSLNTIMDGRVEDLVAAIESPEGDERLQFAREVIERHHIAVGAATRDTTRQYLASLRSRVLAENTRYIQRLSGTPQRADAERREDSATAYRDRGLSTDTSLRVEYAIDQALTALQQRGELTRQPVERIAVVGPGLDFVDKAQGYDLYSVQSIQPFALADSLLRLSVSGRLSITALDISPRVLAHLEAARQRASRGDAYRLHLLLEQDSPNVQVETGLVQYWTRFGERIGRSATASVPDGLANRLRIRALDVRPDAVLAVRVVDADVVVERLADPVVGAGFDLIVATNVLVYYDPFEQALALANLASMLGKGGLLLTNQPVPVPAAARLSPVLITSVDFDRVTSDGETRQRGDAVYAYRKL